MFAQRNKGRHGPADGSLFLCKICLCVLCILFVSTQPSIPQSLDESAEPIKVRLEPGIGLRDLSAKYLGDPDLWPVILRANGFSKIVELEENQELTIPASEVELANLALNSSLVEIKKANKSGAQIFAPKLISTAIDYRDQALEENRDGSYRKSITSSNQSITTAESALERAEKNRDKAAEARLSDRQGWVEGRKPDENGWGDRPLNSILVEEETLRTLSKSTAQVIFRDASRLRLNSNSQAIIQRMRVDPLKRKEEAQISLVKGDFYAVLAAEGARNDFQVKIPDVDATIRSGNFWISHSDEGAKFTNYDVDPVEISAKGEKLTLGRNEGTYVAKGTAPTNKIEVKERVELLYPLDLALVYKNPQELRWSAVEGASGYWLEIAFDARFDRMRESLWGVEKNTAENIKLAPGTYYWRVAALDAAGLPGQRSNTRKFEVRTDDEPPFLQLRTPEQGAVLREASVSISGESEPLAKVLINGESATLDRNGRYSFAFNATEGANEVEILARDEAGNETTKTLNFVYLPDNRSEITYNASVPRASDGTFLTGSEILSLSGIGEKRANISVRDPQGTERSTTISDEIGQFDLNIPVVRSEEELEIKVTTASGYSYFEKFKVRKSTEPPKFELNSPLPRITATETLVFRAKIEPGTIMTMNGQRAEEKDGQVVFSVKLIEGANLIELVATNPVGLVTVEKWTVIFDMQAPEIQSKSVNEKPKGKNTFYRLRVKAKDDSGLAKTARFKAEANGKLYKGVLRYNRARKRYSGGIEIPTTEGAANTVIVVELEDIAGNKTEVTMTQ